jgi:hypothetical protein
VAAAQVIVVARDRVDEDLDDASSESSRSRWNWIAVAGRGAARWQARAGELARNGGAQRRRLALVGAAEATVRRLLVALHGVGPICARDVLETTRVDPATSLAELTGEHRRRLTRARAALIRPRSNQLGAHRRRAGPWQVGAPAARDGAGDVPASGGATDEKESP